MVRNRVGKCYSGKLKPATGTGREDKKRENLAGGGGGTGSKEERGSPPLASGRHAQSAQWQKMRVIITMHKGTMRQGYSRLCKALQKFLKRGVHK